MDIHKYEDVHQSEYACVLSKQIAIWKDNKECMSISFIAFVVRISAQMCRFSSLPE